MAQLSSGLEGFGEPIRSVDEAANHIAGTLAPVADVETVPLAQADARVLARLMQLFDEFAHGWAGFG
jgi:molybdopterin molybdotransferase